MNALTATQLPIQASLASLLTNLVVVCTDTNPEWLLRHLSRVTKIRWHKSPFAWRSSGSPTLKQIGVGRQLSANSGQSQLWN